MNILIVGWFWDLVRDLTEDPSISVTVLEEPSLVSVVPARYPRIEARYQQSTDYREAVARLGEPTSFDLILAGREYGVVAAQWLSDRYSLPSVGNVATRASTDKATFRRELEQSELPTVRSEPVRSPADVKRFWGGNPIVLKPANRHASIGVIQISRPEDIEYAWRAATTAGEGTASIDRELDWKYIAEEWVPGKDYSVESVFFKDGVFHNVTEQTLVGGGRFTPVRHIVPAPLSDTESRTLLDAQHLLAKAVGIERGIVHAEWKVDGSKCWPIEFAVRYPGDELSLLIKNATGVNLAQAWVDSLQGRDFNLAKNKTESAGVAFIQHPTGRYVKIDGMPSLGSPGVIGVDWCATPGQDLLPLDDSGARMGFIAVQADNQAKVADLLTAYEERIDISVESV
ncbi:ATP-grasp domain-containing protein [Streptomyces beigongshangae]|uniref:ATP-grasp domain-containing protein n=1 Tax=Streptomyces beigongshangae TaxID=2841597 RepID=UPI001C8514E7|nr:ATP-grasp domain-containing protein [Streptomyces sp. REN17]